jgi:hypothetical protein
VILSALSEYGKTTMVPPQILNNLAGLRRRERLLTFVWGLACWVAVVLVLSFLCGLADWLIDRERETPFVVHLAFFAMQAAAWFLAGFCFIILPQIRRLPDDLLALWVEAKCPKFDHRLISAVQLNRPRAKLAGMSQELVAIMTREAQKESNRLSFASIADHGRLKWAAGIALPVMLMVALPFVIWPSTAFALLARQALVPVDVPHSVGLDSVSVAVWPIGDTIPIRYRVKKKWSEDMVGTLTVTPLGGRPDRYDLEFIERDGDDAIFGADVKAAAADLRYSARLADGRTRYPSVMRLVPRPVVMRNEAWLLLPEFCGKRPDTGGPYEIPQPRGDVIGIPGCRVRVQFEVAPEHEAWIELRGPDREPGEENLQFAEVAKGAPIKMEIKRGVRKHVDEDKVEHKIDVLLAETTFDLPYRIGKDGKVIGELTGYRLIVKDENGFDNDPKPRRALRLVDEDPPQVALLRSSFGEASFDVEGMPVPLGGKIPIPYVCFGAYGLGKADVLYRVLKEHESGKDAQEEEPWVRLPLPEVQPDNTAGPFDLKTGMFRNTPDGVSVPFHAIPAPDYLPWQLGRTSGGGRVLLATNGLLDSKSVPRQLKSGDQIEYCIEVFARKRDAGSTPVARSESRVTKVLDQKGFSDWLTALAREDERIINLRKEQERVFEK